MGVLRCNFKRYLHNDTMYIRLFEIITTVSFTITKEMKLCLPHKISFVDVCLSARQFRYWPLYIFWYPGGIKKIIFFIQVSLHTCQVWWVDMHCVQLTKVSLRSRPYSRLTIVWLYFVSALYFNPYRDLQILLHKSIGWCAVLIFDQGLVNVKVQG